MTVATTQISEVWTGDASSVTFPIPFPFLDRDHLIVWKEDAGGVQTAMTISTATGEGEPSGGSITLTAPVGVGYTLHVRRNTPKTQETDYVPHDPFPADSHERALDKLTMIVQELLASGSIDIDHFGDLIGGSSTIIWTRSPDGTKLIGSVVPGAGDTYKVKVDSDDAAPDFLGVKMLDENDIQFDVDGEALRNTVFQLSGLGSKLRVVRGVDFDFDAGPFEGAMSGGRGISFGRRFVAGVEVDAWVAQENRGTLHWTENVEESRWKETTEDAAFEAIHPSTQVNGWVGLAFVHVGGAINSWCWLFANADYACRIYYVIHEAASYNADGTINVAAIQYATYASGEGPIQIVDICQAGDSGPVLLAGYDTTVGSTVDLVTFAAAMEADANVGGIGYDGYGVVQVVERDTGALWRSDDSGATFAKVASFFLDGVEVAHLPSEAPFYLDKWGSLLAQYGQWVGVNTGYIAGRIGFVYSDDGVHWFSSADPATRFYSAASDGMRWFGTNGYYGTGSPIFEMIVSVIPVKRRLSMEKGAVVAGPLILRELPNRPILGTDHLGRIIDGTGALSGYFVDLTTNQSVEGVKTFSDGIGSAFVDFPTTHDAFTFTPGKTYWDADAHTLATDLENGTTLQHGQELHVYGRNNSGAGMLNGKVVYCSGATGFRPTFGLAEADNIAHSRALAVLTQDIASNAQGYATAFGLVHGIDTSAFVEGAILYLSTTAGDITDSKPVAPNRGVRIGFCVRSHPTDGQIFVAIDPFPLLSELSDVTISEPSSGQVLSFDGTKWINATPSAYSLPIASPLILGGIKVGERLSIAGDGTLSADVQGGSTTSIEFSKTMDVASCTGNVSLQTASASQWTAHATIFVPAGDQALVQNQTALAMICPQPVPGASYILAIYKWPSSGSTCDLIASSAVQTMPGSSSWLEATMTSASNSLVGGDRYFAVILWNENGAQVSGVNGANLNIQPYIAFHRSNLGTLTTAPATLTPESELTTRFYFRVKT